jgi:hypothetical protein
VVNYRGSVTFNPFPFPDPSSELRAAIADVAKRLDQHRKDALARDERVTMMGMYNVVEKLRSGDALTPRERTVHEIAACGILRDLHGDLDALVARAELVRRHLETLVLAGEARRTEDDGYAPVPEPV